MGSEFFRPGVASNIAKDQQFAEVSKQLGQIRARIDRIVTGTSAAVSKLESFSPAADSATVRYVLKAREARRLFFNKELFCDPAWDMLLDLYACDLEERRVTVGSLCVASAAPATTALRWIKKLQDEGLIRRENDPFDYRRVYLELTPQARQAMNNYFAAFRGESGI